MFKKWLLCLCFFAHLSAAAGMDTVFLKAISAESSEPLQLLLKQGLILNQLPRNCLSTAMVHSLKKHSEGDPSWFNLLTQYKAADLRWNEISDQRGDFSAFGIAGYLLNNPVFFELLRKNGYTPTIDDLRALTGNAELLNSLFAEMIQGNFALSSGLYAQLSQMDWLLKHIEPTQEGDSLLLEVALRSYKNPSHFGPEIFETSQRKAYLQRLGLQSEERSERLLKLIMEVLDTHPSDDLKAAEEHLIRLVRSEELALQDESLTFLEAFEESPKAIRETPELRQARLRVATEKKKLFKARLAWAKANQDLATLTLSEIAALGRFATSKLTSVREDERSLVRTLWIPSLEKLLTRRKPSDVSLVEALEIALEEEDLSLVNRLVSTKTRVFWEEKLSKKAFDLVLSAQIF